MGGCDVLILFSSAILLKGDFRVNNSYLIGDMCLEVPLCLTAIGEIVVLQPRLHMLTNKDIVVGN